MKKYLLISALVFVSNAAYSAAPTCGASAIDPDGDGWGWDNNQSCRISTSDGNNNTGNSGHPTCQNPGVADPDGDGWGWENNLTCKVDGSSSGGGDAFSVNSLNEQMLGLLKSRNWECKAESIMNDGSSGFEVIGWSSLQHCGLPSCSQLVTTTYNFQENGSYQATVETLNRGNTTTETKSGSYGFVHGYNFYIDSQSYFRYAVERGDYTTDPDEIFSFYTTNDKRIACKGL